MSCARRPGGTGGGAAGAAAAWPADEANAGTSRTFCHAVIPVVKTSVSASMLPLRRLARISSSATGPTWWPPMAMYHCRADISELPFSGIGAPGSGGRVDLSGCFLFEPTHRPGVDAEPVRQLREIDPLAAGDGFVGPDDGERQLVEIPP